MMQWCDGQLYVFYRSRVAAREWFFVERGYAFCDGPNLVQTAILGCSMLCRLDRICYKRLADGHGTVAQSEAGCASHRIERG